MDFSWQLSNHTLDFVMLSTGASRRHPGLEGRSIAGGDGVIDLRRAAGKLRFLLPIRTGEDATFAEFKPPPDSAASLNNSQGSYVQRIE